ncbi:cytochrome b [Ruegeria sp. AD91A]|uniref:cytochrome b n=1 Tax=Ruegeria sp. AD91A TaxID=2293862 RepID=UPI0013C34129|nr:cytochrome b [Ruegeria sp. AD91A]
MRRCGETSCARQKNSKLIDGTPEVIRYTSVTLVFFWSFPMPTSYSRTQIALHWAIFFLIAVQFLFHEPISEAWDQIERGLPVSFQAPVALHVFGGLLILALAIWRIALRLTRGAPSLPEQETAAMKLAAHATHFSLYALMLLLPVSGALAWFGGIEASAEVHEVMKTLMLVLVLLHILAALFHQFVLKTNLMARMRRVE